MESKNKVKKLINKIIFLIVCIVLSIAFSFGLKTYIDYQGFRINEEEPLGDTTCPANQFYLAGKCNACPSGMTSSAGSVGAASCKCPAGKYKSGSRTCKTCPTNSYCPAGSVTFKSCPTGKISPAGSDSSYDCYCPAGKYINASGVCVACPDGEYQDGRNANSCKVCEGGTVSADRTKCEKSCSIKSVSANYTYRTVGVNYRVTVTLEGDNCSGKTLSYSVSSGSSIYGKNSDTISDGTKSYSFLVKGNQSCIDSVATVSLSGGNTAGNSVKIRPDFGSPQSGYWESNGSYPTSSTAADRQGKDGYFSGAESCKYDSSKTCYTLYYGRSCGGNPSAPPSTQEPNACYKNNKTGEYTWGKHNNDSNYTKLDLTKEECITPKDVDVCIESEIVAPSSTKNAVCNGDVSFNASDSKSCTVSASESDFYKITCTENLQTKLNPSEMTTIKLGLGFKYNIDIATTRVCKGVFDSEKFNDAYKKINDNLRLLDAGSKDYQTNLNKKNDLEKILKNYNEWKSNYEFDDIKATLKDNQLNTTINFIEKKDSKKIVKGTKYEVKKHNLNILGISNPIDFRYEETLSKTMILPMAYYNINNKVVYNNCTNCIKLSNQYYISDNSKYSNTDYKYTVNVTGLGYNKNWSVKTTDCSLKVISDKSIYRPTDVNDPFLNDANPERETGKNWLSDTMDFTGIIKSDTWKQKSLYEFNITGKNVKAIRNNNHELGANAYIGTDCKLITTTNRYYCSFLRNSMYFQYHYIYTDELR